MLNEVLNDDLIDQLSLVELKKYLKKVATMLIEDNWDEEIAADTRDYLTENNFYIRNE